MRTTWALITCFTRVLRDFPRWGECRREDRQVLVVFCSPRKHRRRVIYFTWTSSYNSELVKNLNICEWLCCPMCSFCFSRCLPHLSLTLSLSVSLSHSLSIYIWSRFVYLQALLLLTFFVTLLDKSVIMNIQASQFSAQICHLAGLHIFHILVCTQWRILYVEFQLLKHMKKNCIACALHIK